VYSGSQMGKESLVVRLLTHFLPHKKKDSPSLRTTASYYSGGDTRRHELQKAGYTGRNNPELDALNRGVTDALSNDVLASRIRSRRAEGKPTGQLEAAARDRGIRVDIE